MPNSQTVPFNLNWVIRVSTSKLKVFANPRCFDLAHKTSGLKKKKKQPHKEMTSDLAFASGAELWVHESTRVQQITSLLTIRTDVKIIDISPCSFNPIDVFCKNNHVHYMMIIFPSVHKWHY